MIEPFLSDESLLIHIQATTLLPDEVAVWWLGQSGFLIKTHRLKLLIDPYLSESLTLKYAATERPHVRMTRRCLNPKCLTDIDFVLCSHKHSDHMDPVTLAALADASPMARFLVPESLLSHAVSLGLPEGRLVGMDDGWVFEDVSSGLNVRGLRAAHESLDRDKAGHYLYLSYVIELNGLRLFHSGDTIPWEGQADVIGPDIDLAFLPINGRDPSRGVSGNMTADEAVDFAASLQVRYVIPHHYNMFLFNTVDVMDFVKSAQRLPQTVEPVVLRCGEHVVFRNEHEKR